MLIYLNGKFVPERKALISVFDHGLLYGDALFETIRAYKGKFFRLDDHLKRFFEAAKLLELKIPLTSRELKKTMEKSLKINRLKNTSLRLTLTRGKGKYGVDPTSCKRPNLIIHPKKNLAYPAVWFKRGISSAILNTLLFPLPLNKKIKSANYLNQVLAKKEARKRGIEEGILLSEGGFVASGICSNIFIIRHQRLITPPLSEIVLAGITRQVIIELAEKLRITLEEKFFEKNILYQAEEAFFTNTGYEILPIRKVDKKKIGSSCPGHFTQLLSREFQKLLPR